MVVLAMVAVAAILLVGRSILAPFTLEATWARMIGAGVLVGSTLFAIWARLALGWSWSVGPLASTERGVRTDGPYAITRHPIYTGLLGMLLGSAILGGLGQWLVLFAGGLVVAALRIRSEERLLLEESFLGPDPERGDDEAACEKHEPLPQPAQDRASSSIRADPCRSGGA